MALHYYYYYYRGPGATGIVACIVAAATETGLDPHAQCCSVAFENPETRFSAFLPALAGTVFHAAPTRLPPARFLTPAVGWGQPAGCPRRHRVRRPCECSPAGPPVEWFRGAPADEAALRDRLSCAYNITIMIPRREKETTRSCGSAATGSGIRSIVVGKTETAGPTHVLRFVLVVLTAAVVYRDSVFASPVFPPRFSLIVP